MTENSIEERPVNLSPEHRAAICLDGLYKADPEDFRSFWQAGAKYWETSGKYHCKNWCFEPHVWRDGRVFMTDNYWGSSSDSMSYELTDENFDEMWPKFTCVMENRFEWTRVSPELARKYNPEDVVRDVASGSGGYSCSSTTWIRKGAKPALAREIAVAKGELVNELRRTLGTWDLKRSIEKLEELVADAGKEGIDYTDAALRTEMEQELAEHAGKPVRFGSIHDMKDYLAERCYCPGEIYGLDGFGYVIYKADEQVSPVGPVVETADGNIAECYHSADRQELVHVLVGADGKVLDALRFDATPNNIRECASGKPPKDMELDSFPMTWRNFDVAERIEEAKRAFEALDEIRKAFS